MFVSFLYIFLLCDTADINTHLLISVLTNEKIAKFYSRDNLQNLSGL